MESTAVRWSPENGLQKCGRGSWLIEDTPAFIVPALSDLDRTDGERASRPRKELVRCDDSFDYEQFHRIFFMLGIEPELRPLQWSRLWDEAWVSKERVCITASNQLYSCKIIHSSDSLRNLAIARMVTTNGDCFDWAPDDLTRSIVQGFADSMARRAMLVPWNSNLPVSVKTQSAI
jgi:hypothetical protein